MKTSGFWIFLFIQRTHNAAFATQISAWTAVAPGAGKAGANRAGRSRRRRKDTAAGHAGLAHCGSWEKFLKSLLAALLLAYRAQFLFHTVLFSTGLKFNWKLYVD